VSTTPGNNETGVRNDVEISITFSKPMNTTSVKQAYVSNELPDGPTAGLLWTDNNTRLVIKHVDPLEYASVASLDESPKEYGVTISGTATDVAGHELGEDFKLLFYTLRDVTQDVRSVGAREVTHPNDGQDDTSTVKCTLMGLNNPVSAGDDNEDTTLAFAMTFQSYNLPDGIVEWRSAVVQGPFATSAQNPFGETRLGDLFAYSTLVPLADLIWSSPTSYLGAAAHYASQQQFEIDVQSYLADYYESSLDPPIGILFKFQHETNVDATEQSLTADCQQTWLHVEYLIP
jgi:hypothetical protein